MVSSSTVKSSVGGVDGERFCWSACCFAELAVVDRAVPVAVSRHVQEQDSRRRRPTYVASGLTACAVPVALLARRMTFEAVRPSIRA